MYINYTITIIYYYILIFFIDISEARQRCYKSTHPPPEYTEIECDNEVKTCSWKRILLLVIAITVHNIPEGLAVGIAFGAVDSSPSSTFNSAR